jgi:hypothetical protein
LRIILNFERSQLTKDCQSKLNLKWAMACRFDKPRVTFDSGLGSRTLASAQAVAPALIFVYAMQLLPDQSWDFA